MTKLACTSPVLKNIFTLDSQTKRIPVHFPPIIILQRSTSKYEISRDELLTAITVSYAKTNESATANA